MKSAGDVVEILEAFDLTGSLRDAARLTGCSPMTVARYVRLRETGRLPTGRSARRNQLVDPYLAKVEEWVERSRGRVRADVVHDKLRALGFGGSERTTRRAVSSAKKAYAAGHRRVFRPWIPEPGMWLQFDWGKGPRIAGRDTLLWCAWLAWSRFRVVIPTLDRTMPTVIACLDETLRRFGGSPTYALTDNERTVTSTGSRASPSSTRSSSPPVAITASGCTPASRPIPLPRAGRRAPSRSPRRISLWLGPLLGSPSAGHRGRRFASVGTRL